MSDTGGGTDKACVFRGTQLGTLIRESPSTTVPIGLLSSTVVRTGRWKEMKKVLIAPPMLESSIGAYIEWLGKESKMAYNND